MINVEQTILDKDDEHVGNCVQACVASVLELELVNVPHFVKEGAVKKREKDEELGVYITYVYNTWLEDLEVWLENNYALTLDIVDYGDEHLLPKDQHCITCGRSPRGIKHAIVTLGGEFAFDPHPSGLGLETISYHIVFKD